MIADLGYDGNAMGTVDQPNSPLVSRVPAYIAAPNYAMVLERLARDPSISMERVQAVQEFLERQQQQERAVLFMSALAQAQQDMEPIARDMENTTTASKYASLAAITSAIRPHYSKHGLAPVFNTRPSSKGELWVTIVGELVHTCGYFREFSIDLLADGAGPKGSPVMTRNHALGSAVTYGRRQLLKMMFSLAEANTSDDDGNAAGKTEVGLSVDQERILRELIKSKNRSEEKFCAYARIGSLSDLPVTRFEAACNYVKGLE